MANDSKRRLAIPRQHIPTRPVEERIRDYEGGRHRVLGRGSPAGGGALPAVQAGKVYGGCPVGVHIPAFIKAIAEGRDDDAVSIVREQNLFPAICGRVCPQETQCEQVCTRAEKYGAVAIGALERYVADYARKRGGNGRHGGEGRADRRVAVIGSGPAGWRLRATWRVRATT